MEAYIRRLNEAERALATLRQTERSIRERLATGTADDDDALRIAETLVLVIKAIANVEKEIDVVLKLIAT
jgi:hypothetical protein